MDSDWLRFYIILTFFPCAIIKNTKKNVQTVVAENSQEIC